VPSGPGEISKIAIARNRCCDTLADSMKAGKEKDGRVGLGLLKPFKFLTGQNQA
jgi:hypothetical protein